jgi:SAM-dependent methyltransferase
MRWRSEIRPCPACRGERHTVLGIRGGAAHVDGKGEPATIVRCRSCHLVYTRPTLLPIGNPYAGHAPGDYFHSHETSQRFDMGVAIARQATRHLGRVGTLLEVGCGQGGLLRGARTVGFDVRGVEMTPGFAAQAPADLPIEVAPLEQAETLKRTFDVIVLAAILEHVYDPILCLDRVREALVPGGLVFIDVPNECSLWSKVGNAYMRMRGRRWAVNLSPTFPPYHVIGFCPRSLTRLLDQCGFDTVELIVHRWGNDLPKRPGLVAWAEHQAAELVLSAGQALGMGMGINCWARRRG